MNQTFVIIKPDAIARKLIGRIVSRFEDAGFRITKMEMKLKDSDWFNKMYNHLTGEVYQDMREFITDTPIIGIVLEGPFAAKRVRKMIGRTDSGRAAPGTIRGDFGRHPIRFNCVHASENVAVVEEEITLFFGEES